MWYRGIDITKSVKEGTKSVQIQYEYGTNGTCISEEDKCRYLQLDVVFPRIELSMDLKSKLEFENLIATARNIHERDLIANVTAGNTQIQYMHVIYLN